MNASGETDLARLLAGLSPELRDGEYLFCTFPGASYGDHAGLKPIAAFVEDEGLTLVVPKSTAEAAGLARGPVFRAITLRVHSSLDAVGLTAAFAEALTRHGVSANVFAGYYHDHIFVQSEFAGRAMQALESISG